MEVVEYQNHYREDIRRICYDTGFAGRSLENIVDNKNLFMDLSTHYFLDLNQGITYIAKNSEKAVGYVFLSLDKRKYDRHQTEYYIKRIAFEIFSFHVFTKRDTKYFSALISSYFHGDFNSPGMPDYPGMIHINIDPSFHGKGIGKIMMSRAFEYFIINGCHGVQLRTTSLNVKAIAFFQKMGFIMLYSRPVSFYNKYGYRNAENLILGKQLIQN